MKNIIIILWLIFVGLCTFWMSKTCCNKGGSIIPKAKTAAKAATAFTVKNGNWSMTCPYGEFLHSSNNLLSKAEATTCFEKIREYQANNPDQNWVVTGNYTSDETNNTIFANLGEARAQHIKRILVNNYGMNSANIGIKGNLVNSSSFVADTLTNGYSIDLGEKLKRGDFVSRFDATKPIILRFDLNSSVPKMDAEIRAQFANLLADLDGNKDLNVLVTGHTDSSGDAAANLALGQERAESIKQYLISNGIRASRILTESKGETMPISEEDAINRRVEVTTINNNN